MASDPKDPKLTRLPFEPGQNRKKTNQAEAADKSTKSSAKSKPQGDRSAVSSGDGKSPKSKPVAKSPTQAAAKSERATTRSRSSLEIPEVVSKRMARRMAFFSGLPTLLGVATFFVSYLVVTQGWVKLPNVAVLLVSMGFFGLGVLGLSYGVLSTCWDEETVGSLLGIEQFSVNLGRLVDSWKAAKQKSREER